MDREKVIRELEDIQKHLDTGYSFAISWKSELIRDALELLKEQEPVKPTLIREGRNKYYNNYVCPGCDNELNYGQNYCSECGRSVKWE